MHYHYLDSNNQPAGPASLEEIQALAREGKIARDPMVCAAGTTEWKLVSAVTGPGATATKGMPFSGTVLSDFVGRLVNFVGGVLSPNLVENSLSLARTVGQYAVLAGGLLGLIAAIIAAIQNENPYVNSFGIFLGGVGYVIVLVVAQFTASRFLGAADGLIKSTPSRLSSRAFLECLGVLAVLAAIGALLGGTYVAIQAKSVATFILAVLATVFLACYGAIALHSHLASVEEGTGSAGEEAIGILAFGLKATLKLVPLAFALLAIVGSLALLIGMFPDTRFTYELNMYLPSIPLPGLGAASLGGLGTVVSAALLPMIGYFAFLVSMLPLEIWRAILSLPGKLDLLRRAERAA